MYLGLIVAITAGVTNHAVVFAVGVAMIIVSGSVNWVMIVRSSKKRKTPEQSGS